MSKLTTQHYNQEVQFFKSFMDPYMKYTSGLFEPNAEVSLEEAVRRMLDRIIEYGAVKPGAKVLEIGCGWGSLLRRFGERMPVVYTGVSPSEAQNSFIRSEISKTAKIVTSTFEEWATASPELQGSFDAIFLVGSYCHLKDKTEALKLMSSLLRPGGRVVIEDTFFITKALYEKHRARPETRFVQNQIFGFAEIFALSEELERYHQLGLRSVQMLEHSSSYKKTIDHWMASLRNLDSKDYPNSQSFLDYMAVFQRGWHRTISNYLISLEKRLP